MKENKYTCPVCFTRMHIKGDTLVCPECGYKYCDYRNRHHDLFDTNHTHAPEYTTYTHTTSYNQKTGNFSGPANRAPAAPYYGNTGAASPANSGSAPARPPYTGAQVSTKPPYNNSMQPRKRDKRISIGWILMIIYMFMFMAVGFTSCLGELF